jgi:hypothetical protein
MSSTPTPSKPRAEKSSAAAEKTEWRESRGGGGMKLTNYLVNLVAAVKTPPV